MSGLLPPRSSKDLGRCLTLPAAVCRLIVVIVVIGVICSSVCRAMSVARTPDALVLDIESCNQLAGCPGCGLNRARPRSYGGGGDRRALGRGPGADPVAQYGDGYAAKPPAIATFIEQNHSVCTPRARLGARAIRWAIRQLRFEGATIAGLARQQPRGIPCGPTSSRAYKPHLNTARFAGVQVLGVDEHVWHHQDRRRRGPRELTGIVDLTRGKDHPTARVLDLVPGRSGTAHENWLEERGEQFRSGIQIATLDPFQGQQERHRLACSKDATSA